MPQPAMRGAGTRPLVQKIMNDQLAMARGDVGAASEVFLDDVKYLVPGANVFAGTYRGPSKVMGYFGYGDH